MTAHGNLWRNRDSKRPIAFQSDTFQLDHQLILRLQ